MTTPQPAAVTEHEALTRTLTAAGWARVGGRDGHYLRLRNDSLPESTVIVPTDPSAPDYRELLDAARASTRTPAVVTAALAADRVETAARVLHERRHRAGYAHVCDACRGDARAVAAALTATKENTR